jgi:hypothetical protein
MTGMPLIPLDCHCQLPALDMRSIWQSKLPGWVEHTEN